MTANEYRGDGRGAADANADRDARGAIGRTIAIYGQLLDSGRLEEWGALFTEDARLGVGGDEWVGRARIVEGIGGMQPPPDRPVKHVSLVPVIDLLSARRAHAWTDFSAFATDGEGRVGIVAVGRYYDELVLDEGRWRFRSRWIVMGGEPIPRALPPSPAR